MFEGTKKFLASLLPSSKREPKAKKPYSVSADWADKFNPVKLLPYTAEETDPTQIDYSALDKALPHAGFHAPSDGNVWFNALRILTIKPGNLSPVFLRSLLRAMLDYPELTEAQFLNATRELVYLCLGVREKTDQQNKDMADEVAASVFNGVANKINEMRGGAAQKNNSKDAVTLVRISGKGLKFVYIKKAFRPCLTSGDAEARAIFKFMIMNPDIHNGEYLQLIDPGSFDTSDIPRHARRMMSKKLVEFAIENSDLHVSSPFLKKLRRLADKERARLKTIKAAKAAKTPPAPLPQPIPEPERLEQKPAIARDSVARYNNNVFYLNSLERKSRQMEQEIIPAVLQSIAALKARNEALAPLVKNESNDFKKILELQLENSTGKKTAARKPQMQNTDAHHALDATTDPERAEAMLLELQKKIERAENRVSLLDRHHLDLASEESKLWGKHHRIMTRAENLRTKAQAKVKPVTEASAMMPQKPALSAGQPLDMSKYRGYREDDAGNVTIEWKIAGKIQTVPLPKTFDDIEGWAKQHLNRLVELTPRAIKAARNSEYLDKPYAYMGLLLLGSYVEMRRSGNDKSEAAQYYKERQAEMRMESGASASKSTLKRRQFREDMSVKWNDRFHTLDKALKNSDSHNRQHSFRLYFFYKAEPTRMAIVGHMPSHLDNTLT